MPVSNVECRDVTLIVSQLGSLTNGPNGPRDVGRVVFSPDGTKVACGTGFGLVMLWDTRTLQLIQSLRGHETSVGGLSFSPDNRT